MSLTNFARQKNTRVLSQVHHASGLLQHGLRDKPHAASV